MAGRIYFRWEAYSTNCFRESVLLSAKRRYLRCKRFTLQTRHLSKTSALTSRTMFIESLKKFYRKTGPNDIKTCRSCEASSLRSSRKSPAAQTASQLPTNFSGDLVGRPVSFERIAGRPQLCV